MSNISSWLMVLSSTISLLTFCLVGVGSFLLLLTFLKNCQILFQNGCTTLYPHQQCKRITDFHILTNTWYCWIFILSHLNGLWSYFTVFYLHFPFHYDVGVLELPTLISDISRNQPINSAKQATSMLPKESQLWHFIEN